MHSDGTRAGESVHGRKKAPRANFSVDGRKGLGVSLAHVRGMANGGAFSGSRGTGAAGNAGSGKASRLIERAAVIRAKAQREPLSPQARRLFLLCLTFPAIPCYTFQLQRGLHDPTSEKRVLWCGRSLLSLVQPPIAYRRRRRRARTTGLSSDSSSDSESRIWRRRKQKT
jgi:hypothetical protein